MKLIILDRDGVINHDSDEYIKSPEEWAPVPGSLDAIARLKRAGYTVVVASNQSGVGRGLFTLDTLRKISEKMQREAAGAGGALDAVFYCPHAPQDNCACRKPKPGLLRDIATQFNHDLKGVPAVGDTLRDIEAAQAVGAKPVLVRTGKGEEVIKSGKLPAGVEVYDDLAAFVSALLERR
ncbi:MAG: D-glycero-beta-D-manno-heptose 1,7-bisphosphate 7-phosphatase [Gammaproteobacteria bacterium]|nr:MAG: D-glycero-beta-D-manno-heptose 1,7-bisphosphate 7-phosphatase [Gammaproteobacteria bacterium]